MTIALAVFGADNPSPAPPAPQPPSEAPLTDVVNQALPSWVKLSGEERARYENITHVGYADSDDSYLLLRFRFTMDLTPTTWLRFKFQAQDSRVLGQNTLPAPATQKDALDLRIGYVDFGSESGLIELRAGRQLLTFGEQRLLGDPDWSNVGRSFDAARLTLRGSGWGRVDFFTGAYVKINPVSFSEPVPSQHLDGAYGSLTHIIPLGVVEPYLIWRLEHSFKNEEGVIGNLDERTTGIRIAGKVRAAVDYSFEFAGQHGSYAGDSITAWALHGLGGWTVPRMDKKLHVYSEWNAASGDTELKDGRHQGFDQLYPAGHDKLGFDDLFAWSNLEHFRTGGDYKIHRRLTLVAAINEFWLDSATDGLYNSSGKLIARSATGAAGRYVGSEVDLQGRWLIRPGTLAQIGYGRLNPGGFLKGTTPGLSYNLVSLSLTQKF
ncbi:MAG TPA: alginate export family protein [Bryobacteraceae bacterium]|jgi:hypothetical protein